MGEVRAPVDDVDTPRRLPSSWELMSKFTTTLSADLPCLPEARLAPLIVLMLQLMLELPLPPYSSEPTPNSNGYDLTVTYSLEIPSSIGGAQEAAATSALKF